MRNGNLKIIAAAGVACLLLAACAPSIPPAPRNLIVICIDTVRHDSFMDPAIADDLAPWLDRAQVYGNAVAPAPWTIPSVVSLFTGKYPIEHGAGRFEPEVANLDTDLPRPLAPEAVTLAEILLERHFRTGAFISHPFFTADLGLDQGFQVRHSRRGWWRDFARYNKWADRIKPPDRIFGYLHFMEAHHRHTLDREALEEILDEFDPAAREALRERSTPEACASESRYRCPQNMVYNAAILELRKGIATILGDLEQRGLLDDTLVVLYSDHGEEFLDHQAEQAQAAEDPRGYYGFGHGQSMYQELLHVPLLIWHPGIKGRRHDELVSLVDVLPSILTWLELDVEGLEFSGSMLPPLRDSGTPEDRVVYSSGIAFGPEKVSVRSNNLKSVFTLRDDRFEFYDLDADPRERSPLEDDALTMVFDTLTGDYQDMKGEAAVAEIEIDDSLLEELKAIGYLQGVESTADSPKVSPEPENGSAAEIDEEEEDL